MGTSPVLARRLLIVLAVFLLLSTVLSAVAPVERRERAVKPPPTRPAPLVEATGKLPADEIVRARVGDVVVLDVSTTRFDRVLIENLGLQADGAPEAPARFEFVADRPGRFPVVTELRHERLGVVVVTGAA